MKARLPDPSSAVAPHIVAFLAHKRALNRRYDVEEKALRLFDFYLVKTGVSSLADITPAIVDAFFISRPRGQPRSFNHLVGVVSRLFKWMVEHDFIKRSPLTTALRRQTKSRIPYIFDLASAQRLVDIARCLADNPHAPLRGATYATIFSLLFGLGLRVSEATRLRCRDIDQERHVLIIRETKFSKSRLVPMGPQLAERLEAFMVLREEHGCLMSPDTPVFSFTQGLPINPGTISLTFHALILRLGLDVRPGVAAPHLHDLRHSFAVGTLLRWYAQGGDPAAQLFKLSTFLGHVDPASTAVYLMITGDLLEAAASRFERFAAPLSGGAQ
jgi:integrase